MERIFSDEIVGRIAQFKSERLPKLIADGYVQEVEEVLPGSIPVKIKGYALTILGNMTYCMSCGPLDENETGNDV